MAGMRTEEIARWGEAHFRQPATGVEIRSLGHALPSGIRELLLETDGIEGEYGLDLLWTADRIASENLHFRTAPELVELYMPFAGLVFFADAGNGDQFFVSLSGNNEVYVWDHENDSRTWVASTVLAYLEGSMRGHLTV